MLFVAAALLLTNNVLGARATGCSDVWGQCGGDSSYTGADCCKKGVCVEQNAWFSQCMPDGKAAAFERRAAKIADLESAALEAEEALAEAEESGTPKEVKAAEKEAKKAVKKVRYALDNHTGEERGGTDRCAASYRQCGGKEWTGATCCEHDTDTCEVGSEYYSMCTPGPHSKDKGTAPAEEPVEEPVEAPVEEPREAPKEHKGKNKNKNVKAENKESAELGFSSDEPVSGPPEGTCNKRWAQCGGELYSGSTECCHTAVCVYRNPSFSWCMPPDQAARYTAEFPEPEEEAPAPEEAE